MKIPVYTGAPNNLDKTIYNRMNKSSLFFSVLLLLSTIACEKVEMIQKEALLPVVKCYLHPDSLLTLYVNKQQLFDSTEVDSLGIEGLSIYLSTPTQSERLTEVSAGVYRSFTMVPEPGIAYSMQFDYQSKQVSAETSVPAAPLGLTVSHDTIYTVSSTSSGAVPVTTIVTVSWLNPENRYHQVVIENVEENPKNINDSYSTTRVLRFTPTQGTSVIFSDRNFNYFGKHRISLIAYNDEFMEVYNDIGNNSTNLKSPNTNVTNGTGIFTAINSVSTYFVLLKK